MKLAGWDRETSPFHEGEQQLQARLGRKDRQEALGRKMFRPFMPDQHREFFAQPPFVVVGSVDEEGRPWASLLFGAPGFISTPDDRTLRIASQPKEGDPLVHNLQAGSPLGFLGIELPTRRRNRVNGVLRSWSDEGLDVQVVQSYGNCPQYIQVRDVEFKLTSAKVLTAETLNELDETAASLIRRSDTFFVATHNGKDDKFDTGGADVSHRGGQPGFVEIEGNSLTIPDYKGNFVFNTFGNMLLNPKAGMLFVDFETGDILQLTGSTELLWDMPDDWKAERGAERAWRFHFEHGVRLKGASPVQWGEPLAS